MYGSSSRGRFLLTPPPLAGLHLGFHLDQQWPVDEMRADMEAIKNDLGADIVRMGEFMWHELEPMDGQFK